MLKDTKSANMSQQPDSFAQKINAVFPGVNALTTQQAGAILGVTPKHVANLIEEGKIKAVDVAGAGNKTAKHFWRIPVSALAVYMERVKSL